MEADELLTVDEAAARLKMHPVTVRRMLRDHELPGSKVGKRQWRVSAKALREFIERGGKPAAKGE